MSVPAISVQDVSQLLAAAQAPRLIDVREPEEWATCHIEGADLLPLSQWPAIVGTQLTDLAQPLIIYCHHGGRSERAAEFLLRTGFTDVRNLNGGIDAWSLQIDPSIARY